MSDERRDDEILGRALSRAIETIDVNETPFERSRVATAPARRSIFGWSQLGLAVVGILLAVAIGSWLARPTAGQPGVAASPTAPASPAPSLASAVIATGAPVWVYFPRDGLPPVGAFVTGYGPSSSSRENAITTRIAALHRVSRAEVPAGSTNPISSAAPAQGGGSTFGLSARIQGDLATVEFGLSTGWGVSGSAQSLALLQQLVYTITEEPGIRRALITETGKPNAIIDQLVVEKALSREDIFGYGASSPSGAVNSVTQGGTSTPGASLTTSYSVDSVAPGVARFVVTITGPQGAAAQIPSFNVYLDRTEEPDFGKASLYLQVGAEPSTSLGLTRVDRSPLRAIRAVRGFGSPSVVGGAAFVLGLDDARPWRVFTLSNPARIIVDVGGAPQSVSDSVAVYLPGPGYPPLPRFTVSGLARTFEAGILWRVRDGQGRIVANGSATATLGTSQQWGTFQFDVQLPPSRAGTGDLFLEVYWASPKDGSDQGLVRVHLKVG